MAERGDQLDPMQADELAEEQLLPVPRPGKLDLEAVRLSDFYKNLITGVLRKGAPSVLVWQCYQG